MPQLLILDKVYALLDGVLQLWHERLEALCLVGGQRAKVINLLHTCAASQQRQPS